jgi:hypothetical protein
MHEKNGARRVLFPLKRGNTQYRRFLAWLISDLPPAAPSACAFEAQYLISHLGCWEYKL